MGEAIPQQPLLDHVVVTVKDQLDAAHAAYGRLGFHLTPRGHHSLGSANHLAVFDTCYLELLGYEPGNEGSRADLWRHPTGLTGLVFKGQDIDARHADLTARGVPVEQPMEFSRPVALPDGPREARFRVMRVAPGEVENGRTFFCHHYSPELVWRPEWQRHPNTAVSVREYIIAARDPARTGRIYERLFGPAVVRHEGEGLFFVASPATVHILRPEAAEARLGQAIVLGPDGTDRMVALLFSVGDLATTERVLAGNGLAPSPLPGGGLAVSASAGLGMIAGFVPQR